MQPEDVNKPKQLLVEGRDAQAFFHPFVNSLSMANIQIQNYGGITELSSFLGQLTKNSNFRKLVTSIGITRDAEENYAGAFQSVCAALTSADLSIPTRPMQFVGTTPQVNVFIFPGDNSKGMLESLLLRGISNDPALKCVEEFISCIEKEKQYTPKPLDKAKALAFLASRKEIIPLSGQAARAGYWNFDSPTYDQLKNFIRSL